MSEDTDYFEEMNNKLKWYEKAGINSVDEGGQLIISIYFDNPHQLTALVNDAIQKMDQIIIPQHFL